MIAAKVDNAAPAAPMEKPKIKMALPIALKIFIPAEIFMEIFAFPMDRKIAAQALKTARNGYDHAEIRK